MVVARRLREADCEVGRVDADVQGQPIPPSILVGDAILRVERVGHVGAELWPASVARAKLVIDGVEKRAMVVKLLHIADYPAALIELRRVERSFAVAPRRNPNRAEITGGALLVFSFHCHGHDAALRGGIRNASPSTIAGVGLQLRRIVRACIRPANCQLLRLLLGGMVSAPLVGIVGFVPGAGLVSAV